jgi:hypothetical protein
MNEIKLAILRDVGLANNGYADRAATIVNVTQSRKLRMSEVRVEFDSLVEFGHLRLVAQSDRSRYYCLPENFNRVLATLKELRFPE